VQKLDLFYYGELRVGWTEVSESLA